MSSNPRGLLRAALRTLAPDPPADSDAELLGRYVAARDQDAFAALVRRHGPMVHGVCRRRLGGGPDADDAFQVTFMVLARDAAKVARRESLPGWLYRVAYLVALKLAGKTARREADPLMDHDAATRADPHDEAATKELKDALDQELAALPDRLRAVVVLCGLEERTNAEAARLLGCPVGTVDSRLSAARKALKDRLTRRGLALTGGVTLEALLRPGPAVALGDLIDRTTCAAVAYAAGAAGADPLTSTADGVTPTMGIAKLKLWAAAGMSAALFGTAGLGLMSAPAGQEKAKPKDPPAAAAKADPPKKADAPKEKGELVTIPEPADEASLRRVLAVRVPEAPDGVTLRELLDFLHQNYGVIVRLDIAAYMRAGPPDDFGPHQFYETKVKLPWSRGMSVADLLTDVLAQIPLQTESGSVPFTYRVRGNQLLIVPAYKPPVIPGIGAHLEPGTVTPFVDQRRMMEQIVGQPVSLSIEEKPLTEAVKELRKLTGANIVIDARCKGEAGQSVSATFDDVRLLSALQLLADMCGLKPVAMNNVYYVTTPENAARLQKEVNRDLFGEPQSASPTVAVPPGFVTDGYQYFPRTADMKPVDPTRTLGSGGAIPGVTPVPAPPPVPAEKKDTKPAPPPEKK